MKHFKDILLGVAYGDAWGYRNEFVTYEKLTAKSPQGPDMPQHLIVSDDTQMTLYLAQALDNKSDPMFDGDDICGDIIDRFIAWYHDPANTRAPGNTCLRAIEALDAGHPWQSATVKSSDGCGANMRVAPAAWMPEHLWLPVAALQAAVTHGSPAAVAAAVLTAQVIRAAADEKVKPGGTVEFALEAARPESWADLIGGCVVNDWLQPLIGPSQWTDQFWREGFGVCLHQMKAALNALDGYQRTPWAADPCEFVGAGWRAHEALAVALLCADAIPGDPIMALRRATVTGGDSDSIAAIAGAVLGAAHADPWPGEWFARLEDRYQDEIQDVMDMEFAK